VSRFRSVPLLALAPVLALIALLAWAFASPIGAGPDDDYHLVSSWCAGPTAAETCAPVEDAERADHRIPRALAEISCFERRPEVSAACQNELFRGELTAQMVETDRGNFYGEYPPVYYAVMGLFTSDDVQTSALLMRVFTIVVFVGLLTALYLLLPPDRRPTLVIGWVVTTIPLGIFLLASNNPSAWATIGVGTSWIALLGYFETSGGRRVALGALYAVAMVMAAGSRGDAAVYAGFATALVLFYAFRPRRRYLLSAILPVVMGLVALAFLLRAGQIGSGLGGFSDVGVEDSGVGGDGVTDSLSGFGLLAYNVMNVPFLWLGNLGEWGLGWLDTTMPSVVTFGAVTAFVVAGFLGIRTLEWRKAVMVAAAAIVLWVLPLYVLQLGGQIVGQQVQPRYLLPLIVLFGGVLALGAPHVRWRRGQLLFVAGLLALANGVALHTNLRRYLTGIDTGGVNLNSGIEWWWDVPFTPMVVWIVGALAYAALVFVLAARVPLDPADVGARPVRRLI
jgi:hypothetical protein